MNYDLHVHVNFQLFQCDLVLTPALCSMLFQLLNKFVCLKISCSVFETGISFRFVVPTFERFSASFSPVCRPLIYEQVRELGVKLRHVVHED